MDHRGCSAEVRIWGSVGRSALQVSWNATLPPVEHPTTRSGSSEAPPPVHRAALGSRSGMTRSRPAERRHGVHQHPTFRLLRHHRLARCGNAGWRVVESCAGRQHLEGQAAHRAWARRNHERETAAEGRARGEVVSGHPPCHGGTAPLWPDRRPLAGLEPRRTTVSPPCTRQSILAQDSRCLAILGRVAGPDQEWQEELAATVGKRP